MNSEIARVALWSSQTCIAASTSVVRVSIRERIQRSSGSIAPRFARRREGSNLPSPSSGGANPSRIMYGRGKR